MTLQVKRIDSVASLAGLHDEWETLDSANAPRTPFTTPTWNLLWWKHLRRQRRLIRDELFAYAVRDGQRLVAVAPMMLTHAPAIGLLRARKLQFFGADPNVTEIRGLVNAPQYQSAAVEALAREFAALQSAWDWLEWSGIRDGGGADQVLERTQGVRWSRQIADYYLDLPATWEELRTSRGRNLKESLRKCYNSLKRDGHRFELRVSRGVSENVAALERFFLLHRDRATAVAHNRHPDYFVRPENRAFILDYAQHAPSSAALHLFELSVAGEVVASRIGFALGTDLYLYYSGFNPRWGQYSVMTTAVAESMKWAIAAGFTRVNLSTGDDQSKQRWHPQMTLYKSATQVAPRWRSQLAHCVYQRAASLAR